MVETRSENLECPTNITDITDIGDWPQRMTDYGYSDEQKRIVNLALDKMKQWFELNELKDWKRGTDKKGLTVDGRTSSTGNSQMRCARRMDFTPDEIWAVLCQGQLRQSYDPNIEITRNERKIAANTYACYQKAKKVVVIDSRDFMIITYMHKVKFPY